MVLQVSVCVLALDTIIGKESGLRGYESLDNLDS